MGIARVPQFIVCCLDGTPRTQCTSLTYLCSPFVVLCCTADCCIAKTFMTARRWNGLEGWPNRQCAIFFYWLQWQVQGCGSSLRTWVSAELLKRTLKASHVFRCVHLFRERCARATRLLWLSVCLERSPKSKDGFRFRVS